MRMEPPTDDTTNDAAPQPSDGDAASAVAEEQVPSIPPPETEIQAETEQPPVPPRKKRMIWPRGSGLPGFGRYRGTKWYDMETEELDDTPLPATTSSDPKPPGDISDDKQLPRRSTRVPKRKGRPPKTEQKSDAKPSEPTKDDKSPGGDREQRGDAKISSDNESIPDARNPYYPKYCIDEFEDTDIHKTVYVRYRIAGGRMKFSESDTGTEEHYTQFPGIELDEIGDWRKDYNNISPCG